MEKSDITNLVKNKKAFHDYEILETLEAGLVLVGSEVKSLRHHEGSLQDAYIVVKNEELWLINASISPYRYGGSYGHKERRERKLLVHRNEIIRLKKESHEKGVALIPLELYLKKGVIKIKIAIAKGKKLHDKRAHIKEKEAKKQIEKLMKSNR
ncbi:MAG: SsrA-binding protein SmpB [Parachlamydiales bacterium]|nr:SsrA-binding protein SmpB [Parachlamydiales bacterium]